MSKEHFNINLDYTPVRERLSHTVYQDYSAVDDVECMGYERLFMAMMLRDVLEFEACPLKIISRSLKQDPLQYELQWSGCQMSLEFSPVLPKIQIPDCDPIVIISPYTNTFVESVCWVAWMEVMELGGRSTSSSVGDLLSVQLFRSGLRKLGISEISVRSIRKSVKGLHKYLKEKYSEQEVFRAADLSHGGCYLLSMLDQPLVYHGETADLREILIGEFNLSCRLSIRDTMDRCYVKSVQEDRGLDEEVVRKGCLDFISHMALYPDGRILYLKDVSFTVARMDGSRSPFLPSEADAGEVATEPEVLSPPVPPDSSMKFLVFFRSEFKVIEFGKEVIQLSKRSRIQTKAWKILYNHHVNEMGAIPFPDLLKACNASPETKHPSKLLVHNSGLKGTKKGIVEGLFEIEQDPESDQCLVKLSPHFRYEFK